MLRISAAVLTKCKNHLWYLSEETIALAFFDPLVPNEEKQKMFQRLLASEPIVKFVDNRKLAQPHLLLEHNLSAFVSYRTEHFFARFGISPEFLEHDPSTWETNTYYQNGRAFCQQLFVVNDTAERDVKFIKDFNKKLTNKEEEKQFLLQIVEAYRKKYPSYKKQCLNN